METGKREHEDLTEPSDQPRKLKVFGERNTATRAVMQMLRALEQVSLSMPRGDPGDRAQMEAHIRQHMKGMSLKLFMDALEDTKHAQTGGMSDWKHAAPRMDDSYKSLEASVIFLVRNPYSWIWSLAEHPYHARAPWIGDMAAFIARPWLSVARENIQPILYSPMELWNIKLRRYLEFPTKAGVPAQVLHFEDFVQDPIASLSAILRGFDISPDGLALVETPTKAHARAPAQRKAFYADEGWKGYFTAATIAQVNELIDWEVAAAYGYPRLDPADFPELADRQIINKLQPEAGQG